MKRSTARWTTAMAAAALIGLPASGFAQTAPQQTPPSTHSTPAPTSGQTSTATSAADHIREAKQALEAVPQASVPAGSRQKLAQIKNHLNNLNKFVESSDKAGTSGSATAKSANNKKNWGTEAAAIDKLVSDLTAEVTDDTAKEKLMDVRRHVTELASSMSGTGGSPSDPSAAAGSTAAAGADTMGASPSASSQSTQPSPSATPQSTQPSPSATPSPSSTDPTASPSAQTPSQQPTSPPPASPQSPSTQPSSPDQPSAAPGQVDAQAAKQHLSEARESLAELTSLPEAQKLSGEARNQVSQLISNFNELITTQTEWKAAYAKVSSNLDTLIGPDSTSSPSAAGTTGTTGAPPAATGTSGATAPIDPAIKAKLQEFRTHLKEFEQAAGGVNMAATGANAPSASPSTPSASPSAGANPASPSSPSNPPSQSPSSEPTSPSPAPSSPSTMSSTSPAGTSGVAGATGTSGTMAPRPSDDQAAKPAATTGHAEADKHIDAIQSILNQAKDGKLDKDQTEQIKTHLDQLRQLIGQAK